MKLKTITKLLIDANIRDVEGLLWQQWLVERPYMETFVSFENYKIQAFENIEIESKGNIDAKKIIEEAEEIKKLDQRGGGI